MDLFASIHQMPFKHTQTNKTKTKKYINFFTHQEISALNVITLMSFLDR